MQINNQKLKIILPSILIVLMVIYIIKLLIENHKQNKLMKENNFINPTRNKYRVTSPFGYRSNPFTGKTSYHNGIDIACPLGTELIAPANGIVKSAYSDSRGGNQLIILHDNGHTTGYAHLNQSLVVTGQRVTQGSTIAFSGNSGHSTGPHLHFTLKNRLGQRIDPRTMFDY